MSAVARIHNPAGRTSPGVRLCALHRVAGITFLPDHPGWIPSRAAAGEWFRLSAGVDSPQVLTSPGLDLATRQPKPALLKLPPGAQELLPESLYRRLAAHGVIARLGSPTVWEAAATAVIRQVVHRNQARQVFSNVCHAFGARLLVDREPHHAFPSPEKIAAASDSRLRGTSVGFKAKTLRVLATWCLDERPSWTPDALFMALTSLPGIGAWTAGVAVCDVFSDFAYYPSDDLAVRTHARQRWPSHSWPKDPAKFEAEWRAATAPHTGAITGFLLADAVLSGLGVRVRETN